MKVRLGMALLTSVFMVAVIAAQDEPPRPQNQDPPAKKADPKKNIDDLPPVKELEKKEPAAPTGDPNDPQRIQKIIERLNKNMDSSEERLNKKDPREETQKIQDNIIKDFDELIKQASKGGGGGGGGGGLGGASSGSGGMTGKKSGGKASSSAKSGGQSKGNAQADNKGGGQDKNNADQTAKGEGGKGGKGGDGDGGNPPPKDNKEKNTIDDLFRDVWGHLPQNKRQEMDAYAKERFLQKYDQILRQYYRTISEQGRRKDGD